MSCTKSVVISCAGTGSRLGLAKTKALIEINGKSLIALQLEQCKNIEDVRVVVGFQANDVVEEVLRFRRDVVFVFNHNYFETKTATSFFLGARHAASDYVVEIDGDLLVHPDDMQKVLAMDGEFVAYAEKNSEDAVFVKVNSSGDVLAFSPRGGDYEWTGPACIQRIKVKNSSENVYNQLEPYLPMKGLKIRAQDIDTYNDYLKAVEFVKSW